MKKELLILIIAILIIGIFLFSGNIKISQKDESDKSFSFKDKNLIFGSEFDDLNANVLSRENFKSATSSKELPAFGNPNAPVKITIFSDYQCPYCKKLFDESEIKIRNEFASKGLVAIFFKDYPFLGQESLWSASAARCANEQGKFWEYHDLLFENQGAENFEALNKENLKIFAKDIGLDETKFNECFEENRYNAEIIKDLESGHLLGIKGTPYIIINKKIIEGAYPYETIRQAILKELQR